MSEPFDQDAERRFVDAVVRGEQEAIVALEQRMMCVNRFLAALNARRGRPLDHHDLADLAQDTVAIAWRKLPEFRPLAPIEVWLHRLCCYEFANALRRRVRERRRNNTGIEMDDLAHDGGTGTMNDDIHLAIERLGGLEADVIRLKHFDGLTFAQIAVRVGSPEATIKARYYRGLAKLERVLRGPGTEGES
jgi:RNA polymerase sigma factor (sigma-70 family)